MSFSIIVPVYNSEQYLCNCIDSVLAQTYTEWELILVDDGSRDNSGAIIDSYEATDKRIVAVHQKNQGQFFARKSGIYCARGDYILFMDSDDYWRPNTLETLFGTIQNYNPDIIMFGAKRVGHNRGENETVGIVSDSMQWLDKVHIYSTLLSGDKYNSLWLKAFRRNLFDGDSTDYRALYGTCMGEDKIQLLYPITKAKNVLYIPKVLYYYRDNPSGVSQKSKLNISVMLSNSMFELLYLYVKKWGMDTPEFREAIGVYYLRNFINTYFKARRAYKAAGNANGHKSYDWESELSADAFRYAFSKRLSLKEKLKLVLARYLLI